MAIGRNKKDTNSFHKYFATSRVNAAHWELSEYISMSVSHVFYVIEILAFKVCSWANRVKLGAEYATTVTKTHVFLQYMQLLCLTMTIQEKWLYLTGRMHASPIRFSHVNFCHLTTTRPILTYEATKLKLVISYRPVPFSVLQSWINIRSKNSLTFTTVWKVGHHRTTLSWPKTYCPERSIFLSWWWLNLVELRMGQDVADLKL